jgi:hypothetical protein
VPTVNQKASASRVADRATFSRTNGESHELLSLKDEPDRIVAIQRDIAAMGLVGEQNNALLTYLGYTSRVLDDPSAIIARGVSGAGKSTILHKVALLFPDSVKIVSMDMTWAAWFNTDADYFKHKVFIAGERRHAQDDTAKDAGAMLRQMISEKRVNRTKSIWDPDDGQWVSQTIERDGPIAYAESTTSKSIFEEDLNRSLQLYVDESDDQNRNVMLRIADRFNADQPDGETTEAITERHHDFQKQLTACKVGMDYAQYLASKMPASETKCRRAFEQVCTVIEAVVLLHQDRRRHQNGYVLANLEDYQVARSLLLGPLHASLGIGRLWEDALALKQVLKKGQTFSTSLVSQKLGHKNPMTTSNFLNRLREAGLIKRLTEGKRGQPATYCFTPEGTAKVYRTILPTVAEVEAFLNA